MEPSDLDKLSPEEIRTQLFAESAEGPAWWTLERIEEKVLTWRDRRLQIEFRATHGFLVALHEVSTYQQARDFADKNRISIVENRGLTFKSTAEIALRCTSLSPLLQPSDPLFELRFDDGVSATVGYASTLFRKLVAQPAGELNSSLPDPTILTTLVITNVDRADVTGVAEVCLFHLRDNFPGQQFEFASLERPYLPRDEREDCEAPALVDGLLGTSQPWAVAFFNRAIESDEIAGFLYFYRVLEACFDSVVVHHIDQWRQDPTVDAMQLVRNIRKFAQKEDVWALREVLGAISTHAQTDRALHGGLLTVASADELASRIYARRNEIAHGRRGQHNQVLVPFAMAFNETPQRDALWIDLMRELAHDCLSRWILR